MVNITDELPKKIKNHGGELFFLDYGDKKKYILENKKLGYRVFTYILNSVESSSTLKSDLYASYYCENGVKTLTDRY